MHSSYRKCYKSWVSKYEASTTSDVTSRQKDTLLRELIGCALEVQTSRTPKIAKADIPYALDELPKKIAERFPPIHALISPLVHVSIRTPLKPKGADFAVLEFIRHGTPIAKPGANRTFNYTCWSLRYTITDRGEAGGLAVDSKLSGRNTYLGPFDFATNRPSGNNEDVLRETATDQRTTRVYPLPGYSWPGAINYNEMAQLLTATQTALFVGRMVVTARWALTLPDA